MNVCRRRVHAAAPFPPRLTTASGVRGHPTSIWSVKFRLCIPADSPGMLIFLFLVCVSLKRFPGVFSDLDGALRQRRQEMEDSSSSDSQTLDYEKIPGMIPKPMIPTFHLNLVGM